MAASTESYTFFDELVNQGVRDVVADILGKEEAQKSIETAKKIYARQISFPPSHQSASDLARMNGALIEHLRNIESRKLMGAHPKALVDSALEFYVSMLAVFI